jgi:hypothetical protein
MQTFLPYPDFRRSAQCLDRLRLGKQRVEVKQILNALTGVSKGWQNHPATKMWRGHIRYLALYGMAMCEEWKSRGYKDSLYDQFRHTFETHTGVPPSWLGDEDFHRSHQSNLLRKAPEHYGQFFLDISNDLPYVWPVPEEER